MKDIILIGGGGHCKSVISTIKESDEFNIVGILDVKDKIGTKVNGIKIVGTDDEMDYYYKQGIKCAFIALGSIENTKLRLKLYQSAMDTGYELPYIVDKTAIVSKNVEIGKGSFIGKGAIINSDVRIGVNCIINTGAIIEHDCHIGKFSHIAPGSTLSGGVIIGDDTHIGTNSTIIQSISIGSNTIIGAGSVVIEDIGDDVKAYGNPCRAKLNETKH